MINAVCAEIKNYFTKDKDKHFGTFTISDGFLILPYPVITEYIHIWDSMLNDGTYKVKSIKMIDGLCYVEADGFRNEIFKGCVWVMSPPKDFIKLVADIEKWESKYGSVDGPAYSPFSSESFGGTYSYSKSSGSSGSESGGWRKSFADRLNAYRRLRV